MIDKRHRNLMIIFDLEIYVHVLSFLLRDLSGKYFVEMALDFFLPTSFYKQETRVPSKCELLSVAERAKRFN